MPEMQEHFPARAMDGVYAENAGAIFGGCLAGCRPHKRRTPKMQEHLSAGAQWPEMPKTKQHFRRALDDPKYRKRRSISARPRLPAGSARDTLCSSLANRMK
ncbi:MAG TPA: hypothetical protein VFI49_09280 [Rudaea sp.]|nr:hypothetical protein [Rudaea sp.]